MLRPFYLLPLLLLASSASAAPDLWDPGQRIEESLSVQITDEGFDALESAVVGAIPGLLPPDLLVLGDIEQDVIGLFTIRLQNAKADLDVTSVDIVPKPGFGAAVLELNLRANLLLNSPQDPYYMDLGLCDGNGSLVAQNVRVKATMSLSVVTISADERVFDVNLNLPSGGVSVGNIAVDGACDLVLETLGNAAANTVIEAILRPELEPVLNDLEVTLEDALKAASITQSLDVLEKTLELQLLPKAALTTADGLEIRYSARASAPVQDPCIADRDPEGSLKTQTVIPPIATPPAGLQIGAYVADDFLNQVFYAAFRGGVLCVTVDAELLGDNLPISLDTSLLSLLGGDGFDAIFPEAAPIFIRTLPKKPPTVILDGPNDVGIALKKFGLNFMADVEGRQARAIGLTLTADVGANLPFDGTTGALAVELDLDPADFLIEVEETLVPGTEADTVSAISGLLDTILGAALGGLTDSLSFTIPSFSGLGLTELSVSPGGDQGDWLLAEVGLGTVTYGADGGGCDSEGGCGGCEGGCDSGCSSTGGMVPGAPLFVFVPVWLLRRRRA